MMIASPKPSDILNFMDSAIHPRDLLDNMQKTMSHSEAIDLCNRAIERGVVALDHSGIVVKLPDILHQTSNSLI